jgi:hypothetical protein
MVYKAMHLILFQRSRKMKKKLLLFLLFALCSFTVKSIPSSPFSNGNLGLNTGVAGGAVVFTVLGTYKCGQICAKTFQPEEYKDHPCKKWAIRVASGSGATLLAIWTVLIGWETVALLAKVTQG